jgi:SAM-dependent methyltransferase
MDQKNQWFADWFDTEYYHVLYQNRDEAEALNFLSRLCSHLELGQGAKVADIACGKGRHSRVLSSFGCTVFGFDLSENSIEYAKSKATESESYFVQDIREPFLAKDFDAAMNLFTSFGYFDTQEEDEVTLRNISDMLKPGAYFVQDYLNGQHIVSDLPVSGAKTAQGMAFSWTKEFKAPYIVKSISVDDAGKEHLFQEKVKVYSMEEMKALHVQSGLIPLHVYGNYDLEPYVAGTSPRIIIISQKQA